MEVEGHSPSHSVALHSDHIATNDFYPSTAHTSLLGSYRERSCQHPHISPRSGCRKAADHVLKENERFVPPHCITGKRVELSSCSAGFRGILLALRHVLRTEGWYGLYDGLGTDTLATLLSK